MEETISKIVEEWFLTEPLLFSAWCTHTLAENTKMNVPMRTGKMRIEYNPDMMKDWGRRQIEERLRFEVIRILLGHPYQRQPYKAKKATLGIASDMTLTSSYHNISTISLPKGLRFDSGLCFEEYYAIVKDFLDTNMQSPPYDIVGEIDDGGAAKAITRNPAESLTAVMSRRMMKTGAAKMTMLKKGHVKDMNRKRAAKRMTGRSKMNNPKERTIGSNKWQIWQRSPRNFGRRTNWPRSS